MSDNETNQPLPTDTSRELYDDFIERYIYTFSQSFVPVSQCASFVAQRKNRDLQQAITYLTRYSSYKKLCKRYQLHTRLDIVVQAISSVRETIANDMNDCDIIQIAEIAFLQAQKKYSPERGIPFKNFLYHYYKWLFVNELKKNLWHAPIAEASSSHIINGLPEERDLANAYYQSYDVLEKNLGELSFSHSEFKSKDVLTANTIDHNWIDGTTCSWVVADLDPMERLILKKVYVDEISIRKVAQELGYYPTMIKNIIDGAKEKILNNLESVGDNEEDK